MTRPFREIEQSPEYQGLSFEQRQQVRGRYFDRFIAPELSNPADLSRARERWMSPGLEASDFAGGALASGTAGAASAAAGIGGMMQKAGESTQFAPLIGRRLGLTGGGAKAAVGLGRWLTGAKPLAKPEAAGPAAAAAVEALAAGGSSPPVMMFSRALQALGATERARTPSRAANYAALEGTPSGDLFDTDTWSMGNDPSIARTALFGTNMLAQMAPGIAAAHVNPLLGGSYFAGQSYEGASSAESERIMAMPLEELQQIPGFRQELEVEISALPRGADGNARGQAVERARARLAQQAGSAAGLTAAPVALASGFILGGRFGTGAGQRVAGIVAPRAGRFAGLAAGEAARIGLTAAAEGAQEVTETIAGRFGAGLVTGEQGRNLTEGTFADFIGGAILGGAAAVPSVGGISAQSRQDQAQAGRAEDVLGDVGSDAPVRPDGSGIRPMGPGRFGSTMFDADGNPIGTVGASLPPPTSTSIVPYGAGSDAFTFAGQQPPLALPQGDTSAIGIVPSFPWQGPAQGPDFLVDPSGGVTRPADYEARRAAMAARWLGPGMERQAGVTRFGQPEPPLVGPQARGFVPPVARPPVSPSAPQQRERLPPLEPADEWRRRLAEPLTEDNTPLDLDPAEKPEAFGLPPRRALPKIPTRRNFDPNYHDLLDWIALNGGLDRDAWEAEGVDPAYWNSRKSQAENRRLGRMNALVFRNGSGMKPEDLLERMQEAGFVNRDDPDAPPTTFANDAVDMLSRAINQGERFYSQQGVDVQTRVKAIRQYQAEQASVRQRRAEREADAKALGIPVDQLDYAELQKFGRPYTGDTLPEGFVPEDAGGGAEPAVDAAALEERLRDAEQRAAKAEREARTDALTGLSNARAWRERKRKPVTALIDITLFKGYNDKLGNEGGDAVLQAFAGAIADAAGAGRESFRRGGDEFAMQFDTEAEARETLQRLVQYAGRIEAGFVDNSGNRWMLRGVDFVSGVGADEQAADSDRERNKPNLERRAIPRGLEAVSGDDAAVSGRASRSEAVLHQAPERQSDLPAPSREAAERPEQREPLTLDAAPVRAPENNTQRVPAPGGDLFAPASTQDRIRVRQQEIDERLRSGARPLPPADQRPADLLDGPAPEQSTIPQPPGSAAGGAAAGTPSPPAATATETSRVRQEGKAQEGQGRQGQERLLSQGGAQAETNSDLPPSLAFVSITTTIVRNGREVDRKMSALDAARLIRKRFDVLAKLRECVLR